MKTSKLKRCWQLATQMEALMNKKEKEPDLQYFIINGNRLDAHSALGFIENKKERWGQLEMQMQSLLDNVYADINCYIIDGYELSAAEALNYVFQDSEVFSEKAVEPF